jgi:uncharacterized membrane protein HdeD (DUF308 family)
MRSSEMWEGSVTVYAIARPEDLQRTFRRAIHDHWALFLVQGAVMTVLGLFALALPVMASLAVENPSSLPEFA